MINKMTARMSVEKKGLNGIEKMTKTELRDVSMGPNQFNANSYGEWCQLEAKRMGGGAVYHEELREYADGSKRWWCRVEKVLAPAN